MTIETAARPAPALRWLGRVYGHATAWRRRRYTLHAGTRRRLAEPVISVGNLTVGGSGKTPVVAAIARQLLDAGERPSILTRGYARRHAADGVVVASDTRALLEPVHRTGDEPQMLARQLPGVPVLVSADRHLAGALAERRFGCTVHLLDDGFQHVSLWRDVDILLARPDDLRDAPLPGGRLREPIAAAGAADVLLVPGEEEDSERVARATGVRPSYVVRYESLPPKRLLPFGMPLEDTVSRRVLAVAGIARPERFFSTLRDQGWDVAAERTFRDHHWFTISEVVEMCAAAARAGAGAILTTEKDAMRLLALPLGATSTPIAFLPIAAVIEPAASWAVWLHGRLAAARAGRTA